MALVGRPSPVHARRARHGRQRSVRAPATSGGAGSNLVGGLAAADGFAIIPENVEEVAAGDLVEVAVTR
ncbi:hypothetical protein [Agromyces bauzanensis]|uniref:hypothetical protein n=1 Tax=Agromyces bauzanensis TaxID=1308924 RepID=UPI0027E4E41C|nr:hypothetical protein [Agromyces bauzanensis]